MAGGRATLIVEGQLLGVQAGDRLRVFGQLYAAQPPANPGEFDYAENARADRLLCSVWADFPQCVTRLASGSVGSVSRAIDGLRTSGDSLLWRHLDPRRAGLAAAMFLGIREELEAEQSQAFLETGTIHLLVVSGLNVAILAMFVLWGLRLGLVPQRVALVGVALLAIVYAAVTDVQPPVVRATVMVLVFCAAQWLGRQVLSMNSLAAAALIVLAISPAELFRAGTQLTFLCVGVLIWVGHHFLFSLRSQDSLDRLIAQSRPWPSRGLRRLAATIWRALVTSTAIWLIVLPLVMARFHLVTPVTVLLGPLLSIPVALAMLTGFGVMLLGWIAPPLADLCGWACDGSLALLDRFVQGARVVPAGHFWVTGPSDWWLFGFYGALCVWALVPRLRVPRRWLIGSAAGWIALGFAVSWLQRRPADQLDCTFLSVGHGTAVVMELPGGQTVIYDAGRLGSPVFASRAIAGYLWSRGITHVDAVVLSHADADHYNALPELLQKFSVGVVYVSTVMFEHPDGAVGVLLKSIQNAGVPLREVWSGDRLRTAGDCRLEVLHPPQRGVIGTDNANSIVLAVEHQGRRILLTGDLESPGLNDVLAESPYDCDVLMAPHHGSTYSNPVGITRWSTPEWVVISGGERNRSPAVRQAYASGGGQVLHTAEVGAVLMTSRAGELRVQGWHPPSDRE